MALSDIEYIVIVILENRSFDHVLGYLSLPDANPRLNVEGLSADPQWIAAHANDWNGQTYPVHALSAEIQQINPDPPHDLAPITMQIGAPQHDPQFQQMGGFVASYSNATPQDPSLVMGYYKKDAVPCFDFFAQNFTTCDHWFSSLPTGTQANRLMAMAGESAIADNVATTLPDQYLVYDWLEQNDIDWCAYQWKSFPFFFLMESWRIKMLTSLSNLENTGSFRYYEAFDQQWKGTASLPKVIFIEPKYTNDPLPYDPNDDHSPTGIAKGQDFLRQIYSTLIANPARWRNTMMIVTYDEHGGFYDHVPPIAIPNVSDGHPFTTTGPRVPAFVVSPRAAPGSVFTQPLDHTSVLQLLAKKFSPGSDYSPAVAARQAYLSDLSSVLTETPGPVARAPAPPNPPAQSHILMASTGTHLDDTISKAFHESIMDAANKRPDLLNTPRWSALSHYVAAARNSSAAIDLQNSSD